MRIEVLYFDGCPGHEALLPRLREILARTGVSTEIDLRRIENDELAQRERFLGSPTVRVRKCRNRARTSIRVRAPPRSKHSDCRLAGSGWADILAYAGGNRQPKIQRRWQRVCAESDQPKSQER